MLPFWYTKAVQGDRESIISKLTSELTDAGFSIMNQINVQEKLQQKIGKDIGEYIIFGVCNPNLAVKAIEAIHEIGLLLPCNMILYKKEDSYYLWLIRATQTMRITENQTILEVAKHAEDSLISVIEKI